MKKNTYWLMFLGFLGPLLFSVTAQALVVAQNVLIVEPDTVVRLEIPGMPTATATADANGRIPLSQTEDDDDNTLLWLGGDGDSGEVIDVLSEEKLGTLSISAGVFEVSSLTPQSMPIENNEGLEFYAKAGVNQLNSQDIAFNTIVGANLAILDGFSADVSTEDDTDGWFLGVGATYQFIGAGRGRGAAGALTEISYAQWDPMEGSFTASNEFASVLSEGEQEAEAWNIALGGYYFVANNLSLSATVGYSFYELEDSGTQTLVNTGTLLGSFSEKNSDKAATYSVGAEYYFTENIFAGFTYQSTFDDAGTTKSDFLEEYKLSIGYKM